METKQQPDINNFEVLLLESSRGGALNQTHDSK
jgi:hypothetical protein